MLGYWIADGDNMLDFLHTNIFLYLKIGSYGSVMGGIFWFLYYRKV
jgi:hypothetical protein